MSDFGFAFNDPNFSDRILRIEILPDYLGLKSDLGDWALNRKRRRSSADDPPSASNANELENGVADGNVEAAGAEVLIVNQLSDETNMCFVEGDEVVKENEASSRSSNSMEYSGIRVRNVHISSPILASKSPFFYKLFSNGMKESQKRHFTLRIQASEEDALLNLLNYMYNNTLPRRTTPTALLDLLTVADKFEVKSCMQYCIQLLLTLPMSCESALLYLDLPSTVSMADTVQQLTNTAKQFLITRFKDLSKYEKEVLKLPLVGIEAILSSDDLQVTSEDAVYDIVVKWARSHYPGLEERQDITTKRLLQLVRFPFMSCHKLKQVLTCDDIDTEVVSKLVMDALFFKSTSLHEQQHPLNSAEDANAPNRRYVERPYKSGLTKVVEFVSPFNQCIVYWDLKREEFAQLFSKKVIYSSRFFLGGEGLFLMCSWEGIDRGSSRICFRVVPERKPTSLKVSGEFAARRHPYKGFVTKYRGNVLCRSAGESSVNLFSKAWGLFLAESNPYFINGVIHLRLELTLLNNN